MWHLFSTDSEDGGLIHPYNWITFLWGHPQGIWTSDCYRCFCNKGIQNRRFALKCVLSKSFNVKGDGRLDIRQGFLVSVAFAYHNAFQTNGIGKYPSGCFSTMILNCLVIPAFPGSVSTDSMVTQGLGGGNCWRSAC
jgi:hypothetical protein